MQPTLVITANSLVPFAQEMPVILSLPVGCKFRSRFPIRWVHQTIVEAPANSSSLSGVLVLRDWETAKLIPVRKVRINEIKILDDLVFIDYTVLEYATGKDELEVRFREDVQKFLDVEAIANEPGKPLRSLVFVTDTDEAYLSEVNDGLSQDEVFSRWNRLVKRLCQLPCFNGHVFPKIDVIRRSNSQLVEIQSGELQLTENEPYDLQVYYSLYETPDAETLKREGLSRAPNSPYMEDGPYELRLISGNGSTAFSQSARKLSGRYDLIRIPFISNRDSRHRADRIQISYSLPKTLNNSFDASVYLDLRYRQRMTLNLLGFAAALLMYILLSFAAPIFSWMPASASGFLQQVSLIIMVLQVTFLIQWIRRI